MAPKSTNAELDNVNMCNICYDDVTSKPLPNRFGILSKCNHKFCWDCIKQWRSPPGKFSWQLRRSRMRCPVCRELSATAIPNDVWLDPRQKSDRFMMHVDTTLPPPPCQCLPPSPPPLSPTPAFSYSPYNYCAPVFANAEPTLQQRIQRLNEFMIPSFPGNVQGICTCFPTSNLTQVPPPTTGYF